MISYVNPAKPGFPNAPFKILYSFQWKNPEATRRKEDIYEHIFTVTFEEESESPGESSAASGKQGAPVDFC